MKLQLPKEDWKTCGRSPPISYKPNATIGKTTRDKLYSLKFDVQTQPVERDIKTVAIYMPLFQTGNPKALLEFVTNLHKIIRGKNLSTGHQKFGITRNLVIRKALLVLE